MKETTKQNLPKQPEEWLMSKGGKVRCKRCGCTEKLKKFKGCKQMDCPVVEMVNTMRKASNVPSVGQQSDPITEKSLSFDVIREHFKNQKIRISKSEEVADVPDEGPPFNSY